jgi:hypothetical protein
MINKRTGKKLNMFFVCIYYDLNWRCKNKKGKNEFFFKKTRKVKGKENE